MPYAGAVFCGKLLRRKPQPSRNIASAKGIEKQYCDSKCQYLCSECKWLLSHQSLHAKLNSKVKTVNKLCKTLLMRLAARRQNDRSFCVA